MPRGRPKGSKNKSKISGETPEKSKSVWIPPKFYNNENFPLAKFIIDKFMDIRCINIYREYTSAFKLVKKFPSEYFWKSLPCLNRIKNLSNLLFGKGIERLEMLWRVYQIKLERDKKIKIDAHPKLEYKLEEVPDLGDNKERLKKPKTMIEFCE